MFSFSLLASQTAFFHTYSLCLLKLRSSGSLLESHRNLGNQEFLPSKSGMPESKANSLHYHVLLSLRTLKTIRSEKKNKIKLFIGKTKNKYTALAPHSAFLVQKIIFQQILGGNRQRQESFLSDSQALLFSNDAPYFFKSCGNFSTGQRGREWVVADGHHLFCVLHTDLRREGSVRQLLPCSRFRAENTGELMSQQHVIPSKPLQKLATLC